MTGHIREARGHRHVGGVLGATLPCGLGEGRERHYAAIPLIIAAITTAISTYAASESAAAQQRYQAKVAKNQAVNAENAASVEVQNRRELYKRQLAAQRAAIGASGIQGGEGSPLLLEIDSAAEAELDLARVRYQGRVRSTTYQAEANLYKFAAKKTRQQGYVSAGASLLQGAAGAYGAYYGGTTSGKTTRVSGGVDSSGAIY